MFLGKSTLSFKTKSFCFFLIVICLVSQQKIQTGSLVLLDSNLMYPFPTPTTPNIQTALYISNTTISHLRIDPKTCMRKTKPAFFSVGSNQVICLVSGFFCFFFSFPEGKKVLALYKCQPLKRSRYFLDKRKISLRCERGRCF